MKSKFKKLPGSQVEVEVTLTAEEFNKFWQPAYDEAANKVSLKGFRPASAKATAGKPVGAPKELLDQAVDHDKVFEAALLKAVRETLDKVKDENEWTLIDSPKVEVIDAGHKHDSDSLPRSSASKSALVSADVTYRATLTIFPEIELGNYKKIAEKVFSEKKEFTVSPEEVEKTVSWLLKSRAPETRVSRAAALGDVVEVDVKTTVDNKPLAGADLKGDRFALGESHFIKGFDAGVIGHKEGEHFSFTVIAPDDYWQKELRGKTLNFGVDLKGVFNRQVPELTDAFVAGLGPKLKTVADLRQSISEGIKQEKEQKENERRRLKVLDEVAKAANIDLPEVMIEKTIDGIVRDLKQSAPMPEKGNTADFDKQLRDQVRERAKKHVASNLVLFKIAELEKLAPTAEEVEAEVKYSPAGIDQKQNYDYIYGRLQNEKVFKFLEGFKE